MTKPNDRAFPVGAADTGLTKRELMAIELFNGVLAGRRIGLDEKYIDEFAEYAVTAADRLIKELNKNED